MSGFSDSAAQSPSGPTAEPGTVADRLSTEERFTIGALLAAAFVMILNETIMNVALDPLMSEFGVSETVIQWLTTGFMLTLAVVIPTTGFIIQRLSARMSFTVAMTLFVAGTALAALAPSFSMLLAGRIVQAAGTAVMLPLLMTTVLRLVPRRRRGVVMGNIAIVISVAPAIGPAVSGMILHIAEWRWLFLTILPIAVAALILGRGRLNNTPGSVDKPLSVVSVLLAVPGFGGLVFGISQIGGGGHGGEVAAESSAGVDPLALGILLVSLLFLAGFAVLQLRLQRSDAALLDLRPFTFSMFTRSLLMMLTLMFALFGALIMLPLFLQSVRGLDTLSTGLLMLPGGLVMALLAPAVGRLYDKVGPRPLVIPGALILISALTAMSFLTPHTAVGAILMLHLVLSVGLALLFTPVFTTAMNPLPSALYSHGSALFNTLQQLAAAVGTAALVSIVALGTAAASADGLMGEDAAMAGFQLAFRSAAAAGVLVLILGATLRATSAPERETPEQGVTEEGIAVADILDERARVADTMEAGTAAGPRKDTQL